MSDQAPDFPLASMPRMGRRNAIISMPDNWPGARSGVEMRISPVDSGRRPESAKSDRINKHPSKVVAHELAERALKEAQSDFRKDKLVTRPSGIDDKPKTPINHAVLKEWKKMRESSSAAEGLHAILRSTGNPSPTPTPPRSATREKKVVKKKQPHIRNKSAERGGKSEVGNLIAGAFKQIPHLALSEEKPKHEKQERPTTAERKRVFDVFNVAEITLDSDTRPTRYSDAKIKKEKEKKEKPTTIGIVSSESDESLVFPKGFVYTPPQQPVGKGPYGKVQAKVNTRWNKYEDLSNNKLSALFGRAGSYHEKPTSTHSAGSAQPKVAYEVNTIMKQKHKSASASASVPASNPVLKSKPPTPKAVKSAKVSKTMPSKAITNYPASESLKNHPPTDKLPLTIGPRFNTKKAWGWRTADNKEIVMQHMSNLQVQPNPFIKMKDILTAHQIQQHLPPFPQTPETGPFKSTFYNLQRLNNGKAGANERGANNFNDIKRDLTSLINFHVTQKKKSPLVLTTIQAPPSPFLVSNVSVPNQLNPIPVNGEPVVPSNKQKEKPKGKETQLQPKKVNNNGGKNANAKKVHGQRSFNAHPRDYHSPPGRRELRRILRQDAKKEADKEKHKDVKNPVKLHPAAKPDSVVTKPLNKFHNIYIGPYSGSESEGEQQNSKNTK